MFVDFDDVFNNNPKSQFNVPPKYIELLNKRLPNGIKYVLDKEGNCVISSDEKEIRIGGIKVVLNDRQKQIIGDKYKLNDVLEYAYNSQQKIEVQPVEEGYIILNDEKFPIDRLDYNPLNPIKIIEGKAYMFPPRFNEKINLKLSDGKYERMVTVLRIPNDSIHTISFSSKQNEPLKVNYHYNRMNKEMNINISFDLKHAKTIRDVVESVYIYNAFLDGRGCIQGHAIKIKLDSNKYKKFEESSALFWEKVLMIESELNVNFIPSKENVEYEKILEIEELYQSLINKQPFRDKNIINSINAKWEFKGEKDIKKYIDKTLFFQFNSTYSADIFDCKIELPALVMIFNSKLSKIEKDNNIILVDESETNKRYTSVMVFKNNEELEKYKEKLDNEKIESFKNAKRAYEHLNNK